MAYTPIYTPKNFVDWGPPDLDASNLKDIEDALVSLGNGLQTAAADTDTNTAAITTINGEISDLNNLIDEILPDDSESGNPAVITDAFGGECKSLVLTLEPIQSGNGTPSPQNVRPINGRTQSVVTRTGLNMFEPSNPETFDLLGDGSALRYGHSFKGGITYTIINKSSVAWFYRTPTKDLSDRGTSVTITSGSSATITVNSSHILWVFATAWNASNASNVAVNPNSDTTFYPYETPTSITRTYGTTIYGGTDDVTGDGTTVIYGYAELDGSDDEGWVIVDSGRRAKSMYLASLIERTMDPNKVANIVCSQYPAVTLNQIYLGTAGIAGGASDGTIYIADGSGSMDLAAFKASLSANPVQVAFKLETYTSLPLSSQNLTLLKGDNVITTDADNVEVEYKADIALYIAKQLSGNLGNRGAKSAPAEEPADDTKEEEKTDEKIIEPVTKEAK